MNRKTRPSYPRDAIEYQAQPKAYDRFDLNNGVPVYTIHAGSREVVQVEMGIYAGNSCQTAERVAAVLTSC